MLVNIAFTIQGLVPRYPFLTHGTNLIPVRNQVAAEVLNSLSTLQQFLTAIGPHRARVYLSKHPDLALTVIPGIV